MQLQWSFAGEHIPSCSRCK